MRTFLIIGFIGCLYLHFRKEEVAVHQLDELSIRQSSNRKISSEKIEVPSLPPVEAAPLLQESEAEESTETDGGQEFDEDDLSQLPWEDIEAGWKSHLKDFLVSVDPEKAEEMLASYLEEKKKYVEKVEFSEPETGTTETAVPSEDPLIEHDSKEGELERIYSENLREIFGNHYSQVEALHKEYVESVQYLNRSSVKFSISL